MKMKTTLLTLLVVVLVVVVGVGAYLMGQSNGLTEAQNIRTEFLQSRSGTGSTQAAGSQSGQSGTAVRTQIGRPLASGAIKSIQGDVIEVTQQDGTSVVVALSGQTVIEKIVTGTPSYLQVGQTISVQGTQATGQVNAQLIQITGSGK